MDKRQGGKRSAEPRDGAVGTEAHIHMIHLAELACIDHCLDAVDTGVEPVAHPDQQQPSGFPCDPLHFERFRIGARGRLFAQHILARAQEGDRDFRMQMVGGCLLYTSRCV